MKRKKRYADGGVADQMMTVQGKRISAGFDPMSLGRAGTQMGPPAPGAGDMGGRSGMGGMRPEPAPRRRLPIASTAGFTGPTLRGDQGQVSAGLGPRGSLGIGGRMSFKKGGEVKAKPKKMAKGGSTASKRADGCATKGKTKGRFV